MRLQILSLLAQNFELPLHREQYLDAGVTQQAITMVDIDVLDEELGQLRP